MGGRVAPKPTQWLSTLRMTMVCTKPRALATVPVVAMAAVGVVVVVGTPTTRNQTTLQRHLITALTSNPMKRYSKNTAHKFHIETCSRVRGKKVEAASPVPSLDGALVTIVFFMLTCTFVLMTPSLIVGGRRLGMELRTAQRKLLWNARQQSI